MVLPKSTVHVSRLAGTALKSFTHGYAQTVVAASQTSYASQNTPVAPLASNWLSRLNQKNGRTSDRHAHFSTTAAGQPGGDGHAAKLEAGQDIALAHFQDAWHKHQKSESKEWHAVQLAKRVGWKPPTTIPEQQHVSRIAEAETSTGHSDDLVAPPSLKRSYSTSAIDNFAKAIDNEAAEAYAVAQVNSSIGEEFARNKKDAEEISHARVAILEATASSESSERLTPESIEQSPVCQAYTDTLVQLVNDRQFSKVPSVFESMLRDGVALPSQAAYGALISSAIELTESKHQKVPRVLDIYSDMVRRGAAPEAHNLVMIMGVLASRALVAAETSSALLQKSKRFGAGSSIFSLDTLEYQIMGEDQALAVALKFITTSPAKLTIPDSIYEKLITACAIRGQTSNMTDLYNILKSTGSVISSAIFPVMINAFGETGDLRNAVWTYDDYRDLAVANNDGSNRIDRIDHRVHSALIKAYGDAGDFIGGEKLLARIESQEATARTCSSKELIMVEAFLPLMLVKQDLKAVYSVVNSLSAVSYHKALSTIAVTAADQGDLIESAKAFEALVSIDADLTSSATALFALHLRSQDVEAGERYFRVLESTSITREILQLGVIRALALLPLGQTVRGLRPVRTMLNRYRSSSGAQLANTPAIIETVEEAVEVLANAVTGGSPVSTSIDGAAEVLRMMNENNMFMPSTTQRMLACLGVDQIANMAPNDLEIFIYAQGRLILDDSSRDMAGPGRFACMLEHVVARGIMPGMEPENLIEKALVNLDRADLSHLWNSYRYPMAPRTSPPMSTLPTSSFTSFSPQTSSSPHSTHEESYDPYIARTDQKGSVVIVDILERNGARPGSVLSEALTKFRNIRRAGRHPRFFAYSKLIQFAAKANQLETAREVLEMAKQDVPFLAHYRVVRHGWIAILDSMVAACVVTGRRDLAAKYHQDLLNMGAAPSANTFGLYITSVKETTKSFDEATEAVSIFLRSKAEGVEPTAFLYNALIGKLGKARRIDDCLFYFAEMRNSSIRPTSVTYGTIVNALCRVSDEKFAEEMFEEMEASVNYKPRPAPYHSLMQFFLTSRHDRAKVLSYYERMRAHNIEPTMHTYKLLMDAHATIEPIDMPAAEAVLSQMKQAGAQPEAVHYASLIHAKGCVLHDMEGARKLFDTVLEDTTVQPQPCLYQALLESLVANYKVSDSEPILADMVSRKIQMTSYIANALIHGWTMVKNIDKAQKAFMQVGLYHREPSTYEAMVRAYLAVEDRNGARAVVSEALSRGFPSAVAGKIADLVGGGRA